MAIATYSDGAQILPLELTPEQLARHLYIIGKSGSGKSTLLDNLASYLIHDGHGVIVIDPHGTTADRLADNIPAHRMRDVCYFKPTDRPAIGFNPMSDSTDPFLTATAMVSAMKHIWQDMWGPRLEWFLLNAIHLCIENGRTLSDVPKLFLNHSLRERLSDNITDPALSHFWVDEYNSYKDRYLDDAKGPILNKVGQFLASPHIRSVITQKRPKLDIKKTMDEGRVLLVNLDKGRMGAEATNLLGALLCSHINHLAMQRSGSEKQVYLIIDEFSVFGSTIFASMLSEIRKYNVSLIIAHQFIEQIPDKVRSSILGNVGSVVAFAVGAEDAKIVGAQLDGKPDLVSLKAYQAFARLAPRIDTIGLYMLPFNESTGSFNKVLSQSRERFGHEV